MVADQAGLKNFGYRDGGHSNPKMRNTCFHILVQGEAEAFAASGGNENDYSTILVTNDDNSKIVTGGPYSLEYVYLKKDGSFEPGTCVLKPNAKIGTCTGGITPENLEKMSLAECKAAADKAGLQNVGYANSDPSTYKWHNTCWHYTDDLAAKGFFGNHSTNKTTSLITWGYDKCNYKTIDMTRFPGFDKTARATKQVDCDWHCKHVLNAPAPATKQSIPTVGRQYNDPACKGSLLHTDTSDANYKICTFQSSTGCPGSHSV